MNLKSTKYNFFDLSPYLLLIWSILSFLYKPILPIASGYGWDGVFYGDVALNFQNMIGHIDTYHANRIFPGILIHYFYVIFNLPLNLQSALFGFRVYYAIILFFSGVLWVQIAKQLDFKPIAKWIGFCALFINYPILNWQFYYPALTDGTAFFIGLLMLYSYLKKKNLLILLSIIISFFSWPAGIVVGSILFIYGNIDNFNSFYKQKTTSILIFIMLLSPLLLFIGFNLTGEIKHLIVLAGLDGKIIDKFSSPDVYGHTNIIQLTNAILSGIYLVLMFWFILKNFNIVKFIKATFAKKIIASIFVSIFVLALLLFAKKYIYAPNLPTVTSIYYFSSLFTGMNVRFPLQFISSHITYWGPFIILLILYFKPFINNLKNTSLPILFIFLYTVIFSINSEGRAITNCYPFLVVALLQSIDFEKLRNKKTILFLFVVVSIVYSKVWLPIRLPSTTFPEAIWENLDKFPLQLYFMNFGLMTNTQMYWLHFGISSLFFCMFYFLLFPTKGNNKMKNVKL